MPHLVAMNSISYAKCYLHLTSLKSLGISSKRPSYLPGSFGLYPPPLDVHLRLLFPQIIANYNGTIRKIEMVPGKDIHWPGNGVPIDVPICGFENSELICQKGIGGLGGPGVPHYWLGALVWMGWHQHPINSGVIFRLLIDS